MSQTMHQAIVMTEYGGPEVLKMAAVASQPLAAGQVRVQHTRIGVNFHDIYVRSGLYKTLALPGTPGIEAVGVVAEVGEGGRISKRVIVSVMFLPPMGFMLPKA